MLPMALNHMTMAHASTFALLNTATALGCVGVELRNDLKTPVFDGMTPEDMRQTADQRGLRILVLAEVYGFNDATDHARTQAQNLIQVARKCGAEAIALIPRIHDTPVDRQTQRQLLHDALTVLRPILEGNTVIGLIEPLGFANSSLRFKADVINVLDAMGQPDCFGLIHDTFHHALAGEKDVFAHKTHIVHISGVSDPDVTLADMTDAHRGLVDQKDRLGNLDQIQRLKTDGYTGPFSFEAFAPDVHAMTDPTNALSASTAFINLNTAQRAA